MNNLNKAIVKAAVELIDDADSGAYYMEELDLRDLRNAVNAKRAAKAQAKLNQERACEEVGFGSPSPGCEWDGESCTLGIVQCNFVHGRARAVQAALAAAREDCDDEWEAPCYIPDGDGDCRTCHQWAGFGCPEAPPGHPDSVSRTLRRYLTTG